MTNNGVDDKSLRKSLKNTYEISPNGSLRWRQLAGTRMGTYTNRLPRGDPETTYQLPSPRTRSSGFGAQGAHLLDRGLRGEGSPEHLQPRIHAAKLGKIYHLGAGTEH